jgi:hypothetical protein
MKAGSNSRSVNRRASPATPPIVMKKLSGANFIALLMVVFNAESRNVRPLSNSIMIRVIVVKIGPTMPNSEGDVRFNIGPKQMPIIINSRTSGILVRLNIPVKRCARNTRIPTRATVEAVSCIFSYQ